MAEEPLVTITLFLVGLLVGLGSIAAGRYREKNLPEEEMYSAAKSNAFLWKITGYGIAGFCFIGLVRTLILVLF